MTRGELERKVAMAIVGPSNGADDEAHAWRPEADAAIRVVLEVAAEMTEDSLAKPFRRANTSGAMLRGLCDRIRRAITAKPGDEL